jgi:hypothetical protein
VCGCPAGKTSCGSAANRTCCPAGVACGNARCQPLSSFTGTTRIAAQCGGATCSGCGPVCNSNPVCGPDCEIQCGPDGCQCAGTGGICAVCASNADCASVNGGPCVFLGSCLEGCSATNTGCADPCGAAAAAAAPDGAKRYKLS